MIAPIIIAMLIGSIAMPFYIKTAPTATDTTRIRNRIPFPMSVMALGNKKPKPVMTERNERQ